MSHIEGLRESIAFLSSKAVANLSALSEESHHNAEGQSQQASKYTYANEIQRLQIWNGEHAVLYGRLDHKLSEASPLRDRILTLLTELSGETSNIPLSPMSGRN